VQGHGVRTLRAVGAPLGVEHPHPTRVEGFLPACHSGSPLGSLERVAGKAVLVAGLEDVDRLCLAAVVDEVRPEPGGAVLALVAVLVRRVGLRWLPAFMVVYLVSLGAELAGTTVGLPFGPYHYTDGLGSKWLGHVPALIPISWFMMALPSYAIAVWRYPGPAHTLRRVALGSFILLSWDLALDPAMSLATKYWIWGTDGPYYGMPLLNLAGWFITGAALMVVFVALRVDEWVRGLSPAWMVAYYGANLVLPVGMCIAAGLWGAVLATAVALAVAWMIARAETRAEVRA